MRVNFFKSEIDKRYWSLISVSLFKQTSRLSEMCITLKETSYLHNEGNHKNNSHSILMNMPISLAFSHLISKNKHTVSCKVGGLSKTYPHPGNSKDDLIREKGLCRSKLSIL